MASQLLNDGSVEEITCRFCLSENQTQKNPLLSPCACKGTVGMVHLSCLNRWRNLDHGRNFSSCTLCKQLYRIPIEFHLEELPKSGLAYIILDYPLLFNITIHYFWLLGVAFTPKSIPDLTPGYLRFQFLYHLYYYSAIFLQFKVLKKAEYWSAWKREWRLFSFPLYGLLLAIAQGSVSPFVYFVPSCFMYIFWHIHLQILQEMNRSQEQGNEI